MYAFALAALLSQPTQAPMPPQAPPLPVYVTVPQAPPMPAITYDKAYALAAKHQLALVIFVATPARNINGCVSVAVDDYNGSETPRIIVSRIPASHGWTLPEAATDAEIIEAAGRQVQPMASAFFRGVPARGRAANC